MRIWLKTTLATSCPLVTNSLGKTAKVPTRCTLAVKHLNTWAACLTVDIHSRRRVEGSVKKEQQWGQVMS